MGQVSVFAEDLAQRYEAMLAARRIYIGENEAHTEIIRHFDVLPARLWDWLNDPEKRNLWMDRAAWSAQSRPGGRHAAGAENHCSNFKVLERIDDYRPFNYYSFRYLDTHFLILGTVQLEPSAGGTRLAWRMQISSPMPQWLRRFIARFMASRYMELERCFDQLAKLLADRTHGEPS